jgi:hypothetical protein
VVKLKDSVLAVEHTESFAQIVGTKSRNLVGVPIGKTSRKFDVKYFIVEIFRICKISVNFLNISKEPTDGTNNCGLSDFDHLRSA